MSARVTVTLKDGRQATASRDMSRCDREQPDPEPEVRAKFYELASTVLTREGSAAVEHAVGQAETWASVSDLMTLFRRNVRA